MEHATPNPGFFFNDELDEESSSPVQPPAGPFDAEDDPIIPTETPVFDKPQPDAPASERIADLLGKMGPLRDDLLRIVRLCEQMRSVDEANGYIDKLKENNHSVYSPATLCSLLERAGALSRVNAEGQPVSQNPAEPLVVKDEDGEEYLQAAEQEPSFWLATPEGLEAAASDKPAERLKALLEESGEYRPIYLRVLSLCAAEEKGASLASLSTAVDADPLLQNPRRAVTYFVDKLKDCSALVWTGAWSISETGREVLASLESKACE